MATMGKYCKAYPVSRFAEFPAWTEKVVASKQSVNGEEEKLSADYFFLHTNYVVTQGVFFDEKVVFDAVTEEWIAFCEQSLNFKAPEIGEPASA